mmetsp:Transcript_24985/g.75259  ORF Transcript_24985/g.75259 Transcript_24985/m.75259 type:complete len:91 (+) Transcript_24985:851-1123(+)
MVTSILRDPTSAATLAPLPKYVEPFQRSLRLHATTCATRGSGAKSRSQQLAGTSGTWAPSQAENIESGVAGGDGDGDGDGGSCSFRCAPN